jgi:elongation factor Ts
MAATAITADMVKKLRDQTGAGMMECKSALTEANGDFEEANTILRKRGLASAAKKAGRATGEGLIAHRQSPDYTTGTLIEVNCESDFVARTPDFQQLMNDVLDLVDKAGDSATDAWLQDPEGAVKKRVAATIAKLGENMAVSRLARFKGDYVGQYIHSVGGKLGVQVEFSGVTPAIRDREEFKSLVREITMHIAAASPSPQYVTRDKVPADVIEKERAIYRAQMENSGKPANILDKIVEGKLGSFYQQVVLLEQESVIREAKPKIKDVIAEANKTLGATIAIRRFARIKVGESA